MTVKQGETTSVWGNDKVTIVLAPEVYYKFVSCLYREHDDIVRAMTLAQVKLEDGSALDFLNTFLGTNVNKQTPPEIGYAQLLDALNMRIKSRLAAGEIEKIARQFSNHEMFPHRSDPTKPIFPDEPTE